MKTHSIGSIQLLQRNYSFEDAGSGYPHTFLHWDDPENQNEVKVFNDPATKKTGNDSCRMESYGHSEFTEYLQENVNWNISGQSDPRNDLRIRAYLRTQKVDTFRMVCPWQWVKCGKDFLNPTPNKGNYKGSVNHNWSYNAAYLPHEDVWGKWKTRAADVAVASWCWKTSFPDSPYLKNIWFEPFLIFEKEVIW